MKKIFIDIDGVITVETEGYTEAIYEIRTPRWDMINIINALAKDNEITLYTARHEEDRNLTTAWLAKHNVEYHVLIMDKPHYDILIDDKAIHSESFLTTMINT